MSRKVLLTAAVLIVIGLALDALRGDRRSRHDHGPVEPPLLEFLLGPSDPADERTGSRLDGQAPAPPPR
ncbi:hypothetical protein [Paludisphaera soli]|uniref:hypothetical protein n=1 Tax=Paludisphaera soli TaxID=2712865 RepID=UPI0013EBA168|nr:hypothetical protein [Paludisphaera soli]